MSHELEAKQTKIPSSLDLVDRAKLGINGLMGTVDPEVDYECYFLAYLNSKPQYMIHYSSQPSGVMPKYLEAMALLRGMSGSTELQDIEQGMLEATFRNTAEDGLIYDRADPRRPWNVGVGYGEKEWNEDYANMAGNGRLVCGLDFYYQLTGDEMFKQHMKRTSERMLELAITKEDYAYYPYTGLGNDFSWPRESGWTKTDEPQGPFEGYEGATTFYQSLPIRGWTRWYKHSGDERMIDISRRFARLVMKPKFWGGKNEPQPEYGRLRGHWHGHFHGTLAAFRGLLEYGIAAHDYRVLEFVRNGYEWMRQHTSLQLGCDASTEGCAIGDIAALSIQLSDAGMGDYWEDADHLARNALPELQFTDAAYLRAMGEAAVEQINQGPGPLPGQVTTERILDRNLGAMSHRLLGGLVQYPMMMSCCNANASQAFYYLWEAAARHEHGTVTVNLFFNRFSPWLDVISYLPYEGKVAIQNKTAQRINIRIPAWVSRGDLKCLVNDKAANSTWLGRYLQLDGLKGAEKISLEFPLKKETLNIALSSVNADEVVKLKAEFKGSTCLNTTSDGFELPKSWEWGGCKLFHRPEYQADRAPLRKVPYYVVEKPIRWY